MQIVKLTGTLLIISALASCASFVVPAYSPDYPTVDRLKVANVGKLALGVFQPRAAEATVNHITLRGAPFAPPTGSFAEYLENAMRSDLTELRVLDPGADTRIDAVLLKNDIDVSGLSTGSGIMEVKITVSKKAVPILEKTYDAEIRFESSFAAAVAVPKGQSEYPNLVRALLQKVYADREFLSAISK
jgi:hypothetical protein